MISKAKTHNQGLMIRAFNDGYEKGRADGKAETIGLIDRHLWNYSHEVWKDFKPILEQMMEQE